MLISVARSATERWQKSDELAELAALTETAGGVVVERILQIRPKPDPGLLIGSGKAAELRDLCAQHSIELLIFNESLTGSQVRNLEQMIGVRTIDRTTLILDIFARHARTAEAKTQVELAQLEYRASQLVGLGGELSRLGGGIGTLGPGETKLEVDRRRIRQRITRLKKSLVRIEKERQIQRQARRDELRIALAGYTNAGKSTLMNRLTNANVKIASHLFATLDSRTKIMVLNRVFRAYLTDTVGFIRNLPHQLITGFRSTLAEIREADLILHVVDAADADAEGKIRAVEETLKAIGAATKPVIIVLNKIDRVFAPTVLERLVRKHPHSVPVSALTGDGIERLREAILNWLKPSLKVAHFTVPQLRGDLISKLYESGEVLRTWQANDCVRFRIRGLPATLNRIRREILAARRRE